MKSKIDIQLELLQELHEICSDNNLKYILYGTNALNGYLNGTLKEASKYISVAMTNGDIERFCRIIEKDYSEDRYVEGIFNNPFFIPFYVTYGNKNTTDFFVANPVNNIHYGINIRLYPIFRYINLKNKKFNVWSSQLDEENEFRQDFNDQIKGNVFWKKNVTIPYRTLSRNSKNFYEDYKKYNAIDKWNDIQKYSIVRIDKKTFSSDLLKDTINLDVDDITISLPDDTDAFFTRLYGEDFRNRHIPKQYPTKREIIDTETGYMDIFKENEKSLKEVESLREEIAILDLNVENERQTVENFWRLIQMTHRQVTFRHQYNDMLNANSLFEKDLNDKEELNEVYRELRPVINALDKYAKFNMTFSVSPKIDELIQEVLIMKNDEKLANKIRELSQKEYLIG